MKKITVRNLTVTAMLSAVAAVLMMLQIKLPFIPSFISFDISDLPPLLASFALGPSWGITVCLLKNVLHAFSSSTGGVGELSNFIISGTFVFVAGMIYKRQKTRKGAIVSSVIGAAASAVICVFSNYFIIYPLFGLLGWKSEIILGMYQAILPSVQNMWQALIIFNLPFTFVKGLCSALLAFAIYKPLSPILKGRKQ